jgi:hypothetical protein
MHIEALLLLLLLLLTTLLVAAELHSALTARHPQKSSKITATLLPC